MASKISSTNGSTRGSAQRTPPLPLDTIVPQLGAP
jgi:hypothetical protein